MNILNIEHIHKIFGDKVIFDDISCGIDQGEKIGIIGVNGTGKTTLLRVIAGEEEPDEGQVITQNGIRISWLPQTPEFPQHMTILDYVAEGKWQKDWSTESEARRMLNTLGITDENSNMDNLSGGEKKRVALARMLLNPADILILDEPTNHLDGEMVTWLEDFLRNFRGTVIMVTHDRYFLDRVANRILEISHGKLYSYAGDYSRFLELKAQREEMELASDRKRRSVLRMELEWAARGCRARSTKQRARLDRLEALKAGKTPVKDQNVEMDSVETRMGKKTVEFHHVSKSIEGRLLINDFDYIVLRDQRLGIIGPNGCGKSTLLKMVEGLVAPDSGEIQIGETIRIGYLAQNVPDMDGRQRVIDYIREVAEYVPTKEGRITASQMLERFLFDPAMQYTPVEKLSGGEKRRLYLLKVLMEAPNVLLLDEPGNDLDIPTMTILEDYLDSFSGIVITVSHDRYFLNKVCTQIADIDYGKIKLYAGNYDFWYESSQLLIRQMKEANKKKEEKIKELQEFISRFSANASKSKQATSRKRALEKIQLDDIQPSSRKYPYIDFRPNREIGNEVLTVEGLSKTIDGEKVLDNISFTLGHDDKVAFVGSNELAKTTLFQILMGEMEPDEGTYKWGITTSRAYFPLDSGSEFDNDYSIVDWLTQYSEEKDATYVRGFLGRMLFAGDDGVKKVKVLSGGEKVRCLLSKMMISGANVLIFDEPTNHLDMESITALNNGMTKFPGVILFSSRDHQIVQTTANRIMEIVPGGKMIDKITTYDEYLESDEMARKRHVYTMTEEDN